jgi:hypothetical protein
MLKIGQNQAAADAAAEPGEDFDDDDDVVATPREQTPRDEVQQAIDDLKGVLQAEEATVEVVDEQTVTPENVNNLSDIAELMRQAGSNTDDAADALEAPVVSTATVAPPRPPMPSAAQSAPVSPSQAAGKASEDAASTADEEPVRETPALKSTGGSALSPEAQRKAAAAAKAEERANAMGGMGGGGGGIFSGAINAAGSLVGKTAKGAGKVIKHAGGQRIADRFLFQNDPIHVAEGLHRARYRDMNRGIKEMASAINERNSNIQTFNNAVERTFAGQQLKDMAAREKTKFSDFLAGLENGSNTSAEAQGLYKNLQADPQLHRMASAIDNADERLSKAFQKTEQNFSQLVANHSDKINPQFEENRIMATLNKADENKPLALETKGNDPEAKQTAANSKSNRKKFEEALDKMKEAIAAVLRKIAAALGMK